MMEAIVNITLATLSSVRVGSDGNMQSGVISNASTNNSGNPISFSDIVTRATVVTTERDLTTNLFAVTVLPFEQCIELGVDPYDNLTEFRCLEHAPTLSHSGVIRVIVLAAMAVISMLGNVATMWNIHRNRASKRVQRHTWSAIYSLIFHLSISDVLVTCFCIIGEAAWTYTVEWLAGEHVCKAFKLLQMFSLYLSTNVMVLIGIDRWVAVKYPMKSLNTSRRCHRFLVISYVLSFILSLPQVSRFILTDTMFINFIKKTILYK